MTASYAHKNHLNVNFSSGIPTAFAHTGSSFNFFQYLANIMNAVVTEYRVVSNTCEFRNSLKSSAVNL